MIYLNFVGLILFSFLSFANKDAAILLPQPNTIAKVTCGSNVRTTTSGSLYQHSQSERINTRTTFPGGSEQATLEFWNRFALIYTNWESGPTYSYAKLVSGDLDKMALNVGKKYAGQIAQTVVTNKISKTDDWNVNVSIVQIEKVKFKNESVVAYLIKMQRQKISGARDTVTAEFRYLPKYHQSYSVKVQYSGETSPHECMLTDVSPVTASTAKPKK